MSGLAVSPGFIDVHAHDDFAVLLEPELPFKLLQGVTTVVVGNCGSGVMPFEAGLTRFRRFHPGANPPPWRGFGEYLRPCRRGPARASTSGCSWDTGRCVEGRWDWPRGAPARPSRARCGCGCRRALEAGALGLSSGLFYEPGCHARADELVALAREMAQTGGIYTSHIRDEGPGLLDSIHEAIGIGRAAQVPVQISHHKASGRSNWGRVHESLRLIEAARDQGPRRYGGPVPVHGGQHHPPRDGAERPWPNEQRRTRGLLGHRRRHRLGSGAFGLRGPDRSRLLRLGGTMTADEAAARVLAEEGEACVVIVFSMSETDVRTVLAHPTTMIGSDGVPAAGSKPHPRSYGCFPRVLGRYVREAGVLDLATAIHRMTGMPAGEVRAARPGHHSNRALCADLVVFDPARIAMARPTSAPRQYPGGHLGRLRQWRTGGARWARDRA